MDISLDGLAGWGDPLVLMLATGALVILLLHASAAKLGDRSLFEQHLAAYGVPDAALTPLSWGLPVLELGAALGLMTPWRPVAAVVCAALLGVYAAVMAWQLAQGRRPDCGCGGGPLPLSWALVLRNVALISLAAVAAQPSSGRAIGVADVASVVAGWVLLSLLYTAFNQVLRQSAALSSQSSRRSST